MKIDMDFMQVIKTITELEKSLSTLKTFVEMKMFHGWDANGSPVAPCNHNYSADIEPPLLRCVNCGDIYII